MQESGEHITLLLEEIARGSETAREELIRLVYDRLRRKAGALVARERSNHSLQPTALVHEAYFKLFVGKPLQSPNRAYFFGAAARAMRQVLVDYARARSARPEGKRTGALDELLMEVEAAHRVEVIDLDDALEELAQVQPRQADVVVHRFFGGLKWEEIGTCLNMSTATVEKDWQKARAWLYIRLQDHGHDAGTTATD